MTPEQRAKDFLTDHMPTMEGYAELVAAFRNAYLAGFNDGLDEARETGERLDLGEVY